MKLHSDNVEDVASASNFKEVKTSHLHLDLSVNFNKKEIIGTVELTLQSLKDGLKRVSLDSHETVMYRSVRLQEQDKNLPFLVKPFADYGTNLVLTLPREKKKDEEFVVVIEFVATTGAGVCWLEPEQTADKRLPFLYTQGQAVLNRSFFPCQDTPAVKSTYSACVTIPDGFTAIMSASSSSFGKNANLAGSKECYYFKQDIPVQSYLVALAVGDLKSAPIGPRSSVWAEPSVLDRAKAEFDGDVERFIQTGEQLFGEYVWGRYDILIMPPSFPFGGMENPGLTFVTPCIVVGDKSLVDVVIHEIPKAEAEFCGEVERFIQKAEQLFGEYVWTCSDILVMPPSFPFGGMENPCLTFVTPCIVTGDKSLIKVVIHEISHSWFGNLVTNANWSEFWLNEGFTMFAQRRIEEEIYGKPFMCLEASTGQALLKRHIEQEGNDHPLTKLRVVIEPGVDPDDTYNETPYEKGFSFVCYLRSLTGNDNQVFDGFLKAYVQRFQKKSIVAEDLFDFFFEYFPKLREDKVHERPGFEFASTWLDGPGWPPYSPDLSDGNELTLEAEQTAQIFAQADAKFDKVPDVKSWMTYKILHFLDQLCAASPLPRGNFDKLLSLYPWLPSSQNAEIQSRWGEVVIKNDVQASFKDIRSFLHSQGKQKYTKPLYQLMVKGSPEARQLAREVYQETREALHTTVRGYVEDILRGGKLL